MASALAHRAIPENLCEARPGELRRLTSVLHAPVGIRPNNTGRNNCRTVLRTGRKVAPDQTKDEFSTGMEAFMTRLQTTTHNNSHKSKLIRAPKQKKFAEAPIRARVNPLSMTTEDSAKVDEELRRTMIETAAYFLAELRHFEAGHELDDWCAAENQVADRINMRFSVTSD